LNNRIIFKSTTVQEILAVAGGLLAKVGIDNGQFEAEYLLQELLTCNRASLFLRFDEELSPFNLKFFAAMIERRCGHEPLQYITGRVEFWSLDFFVSPAVLIPRPETEFVLEQVLSFASEHGIDKGKGHFLDMCTGSGVMAVVLAMELAGSVIGVDNSLAALLIAGKNVRRHNYGDRISLVCSNLFNSLAKNNSFDLIVANPPYIGEQEKQSLPMEVACYEPEQSLFSGNDGLDCYRRLIPASACHLRKGGLLCLEIGAAQADAIVGIMAESGFGNITVRCDYSGRPRFVGAVKRPKLFCEINNASNRQQKK
jgi:release factor glutamine methyltransferase